MSSTAGKFISRLLLERVAIEALFSCAYVCVGRRVFLWGMITSRIGGTGVGGKGERGEGSVVGAVGPQL